MNARTTLHCDRWWRAAQANMMIEEVSGGIGSKRYGRLSLALLAVLLAGLMIGRTTEFLGKPIKSAKIRWLPCWRVVTPVTLLMGAAIG